MSDWISVEEKLPEIDRPVMTLSDSYYLEVYQRIDTGRRVSTNTVGDWGWYEFLHNSMLTVTHWMPMLELPKDDNHELN